MWGAPGHCMGFVSSNGYSAALDDDGGVSLGSIEPESGSSRCAKLQLLFDMHRSAPTACSAVSYTGIYYVTVIIGSWPFVTTIRDFGRISASVDSEASVPPGRGDQKGSLNRPQQGFEIRLSQTGASSHQRGTPLSSARAARKPQHSLSKSRTPRDSFPIMVLEKRVRATHMVKS